MRKRFAHILIVAAFASGVGHLAWRTVGPYPLPVELFVGGDVTTLRSPDLSAKNLYLRRTLFLPKRPRSAWLRVLARDELHVLVNGKALRPRLDPGRPVVIVADVAPYLRVGKNVLAIYTRKRGIANPPAVAIDGAYRVDNVEHKIDSLGPWRSHTSYERRAAHWHAIAFDDSHWPLAQTYDQSIVAKAEVPIRAISEPISGRWIMPDDPGAKDVHLRYDFDVAMRSTHAWLRLWSTSPYRLAINGHVIDAKEDQLAVLRDVPPTQWIYDISPLIRQGPNFVSLMLLSDRSLPRVRVDLEVSGPSSERMRFVSDENWSWQPNRDQHSSDWLAGIPSTGSMRPVYVAEGDLGLNPFDARRRTASWALPPTVQNERFLFELAVLVIFGICVYTVTALMGLVCERPTQRTTRALSPAMLALVVPGGLAVVGLLLSFDPRIPNQMIFRSDWLYGIIALVVIQWAFLTVVNRAGTRASSELATFPTRRSYVAIALVVGLVTTGGYLRVRTMAVEELSPDETSVLRQAHGLLERGFPSVEIHEDLPIVYTATSEMVYFGSALMTLLTDDDRLIVRTPTVIWGTLTILVIYLVGRTMFGRWVGITAAAMYSFSPLCLEMCHIGRYYSQLQILALLTIYFFYRLIEPRGPLNRRMLCLTVMAFVCMFLSWEGSALIAPGLVVAALFHRRNRLRTIFAEPGVWIGGALVLAVVVAQSSHRACVQTLRMLYGSGSTDVALTPMWSYPGFDPWYYVRLASWSGDALLPILTLFLAVILSARHRHRAALRILLITFLGAAFVHAIALPVTAKRYAYDLLPMLVLLSATAVVAIGERLAWGDPNRRPAALRLYARGVGSFVVLTFLVLSCSMVTQFDELPTWRGAGSNPNTYRVPEHEAASQFVAARLEPGDVVISNVPHATDRCLGRKTDYWVQTQLHLQAILDDKRSLALHRLTGTPMIANVAQLEDVFARHARIWFISFPSFHGVTNSEAGSEYIRQHMDVVYEGFGSVVFLRSDRHRPAAVLDRTEAALRRAGKPLLP